MFTNSSSSSISTSSTTAPPMVKIISRETIKPSNPTPHHLRTSNFSFLDLLAPPVYIPLILFYETNNGHDDPINKRDQVHDHHYLKKSLAETLTGFYPLTGKINGSHQRFFVDCTDDGVDYFEARVVNSQLHETIKNPDIHLLNQFLPIKPHQSIVRTPGSGSSSQQPILVVQVNVFDCGGLALGVSISHEVADATTLMSFVQTWAANSIFGSGTKLLDPPLMGPDSLFPPRSIPENPIAFFREVREDILTKRFVFDSAKIDSIRKMIAMKDGSYLTRVETVSSFIWKRYMNIHQSKVDSGQTHGSLKSLCVGHAVNVRKRMDLPQNTFGNLYFSSLIKWFSIDGSEKEYDYFVSQLRDTIRKIDSDYVMRELQSEDDHGEYLKFVIKVGEGLARGELETLNFTSWCRMGYYEVDFGWGKPEWVSSGTMPLKDLVVLMDTKSGDRIEVWANMIKEDIDVLENDEEFLVFVS